LKYIDKLCILNSFLGLGLEQKVFLYLICRHFGDLCTNFIFIAEFIEKIPEELRDKCIFAITSPKQIILMDETYLHANYGQFDDYNELIKKESIHFIS
jgi:hypothetical protein